MPYANPYVRACALAALTLGCVLAVPFQTYAQNNAKTEAVVTRQFSAKAGELVLEAQNLLAAEQYQDAILILAKAITLSELTPFERAVIHQMQGSIYYALEQFPAAIIALEKAVGSMGLNAKERSDLEVKIAQLMIANGQNGAGAEKLEAYLSRGGAFKSEYAQLLTQAWIELEAHDRALPWAKRWFETARPKERKHYDLLNFLYNKLGEHGSQADLVKEMIERWPQDRDLWTAWTSLFSNAGQDDEAFAVSKLLYLGGAVKTETEILKLVQYYSYYDMPYQAAKILERELNSGRVNETPETLTRLATLLRQAREYARAIPVLEAVTRSLASAQSYAQFGEALFNEGECGRAEIAFKHAIDQGYNSGKAWTLIATCRYEGVQRQQKLSCKMSEEEKAAAARTKARESTIAAFKNVPPTSSQKRNAEKWISFINVERETFDKRCEFERIILEQECQKEIERSYTIRIFEENFKVSDKCKPFKKGYDAKYRVGIEG
ncbi:tetratricopeptide repeat protein [Hellea balneolensis]|uniref:tetratricopeptide repeat protein n=1 Tax=Hellea balneolensis TaxID=287478 RepID=UPI0003F997EB|nr:hypothetical protein [Hellea balneolensis]